MRKLLPLIIVLLSICAWAQYTSVTATVKDSSNTLYVNGSYDIIFVPNPTGTTLPMISGAVVYPREVLGQIDSFGTLAATLADNSLVTPSGSQWRFRICAQDKVTCFATSLTISGASQNVTAALQSAAAPLPNANTFTQQIISTVATGTAPFSIASTTQVANLDAATTGAFDHTPTGCTNQAAISIAASGNLGCATVTSAYVNNSIALTGTDINTSNQVTATHLASALPVLQGGTGVTTSTGSGNVVLSTSPTLTGTTTAATITGATLTNPKLTASSTIQDSTGAVSMGITLKKGSGGGDYSSASTTYVRVDSTNLAFTVTIPTGWKLSVVASGSETALTGAANTNIAIADGSADNTGILVELQQQSSGANVLLPFSLGWVINGDGASHTINLQYKTQVGADSAKIVNSTSTLLPTMVFTLMPSN